MGAERCSSFAMNWFRPQTRSLLQSAARAVIWSRRGSLFQQVKRLEESATAVAPPPRRRPADRQCRRPLPPLPKLEFFNGLGGFAAGGGEYVTVLGEGQWTPAPWINVIANPSFGFQVSVEGGGYTWSINSQQNQISSVVQRPGQRSAWRSLLPSRRRQRRTLGSHGSADSRRNLALRRPAWSGLQPFRAHFARNLARASAIRAARRPDQDLPAEDPQSVAAIPAGSRSPPTWNGCWALPAPPPPRSSRRRSIRKPGRCSRKQPLERRVWQPRRLRRPRWTPGRLDR